jgi:hypothetical protein
MSVARLRSQVERLRRAVAAQGPVFRWSLALAAVALVALLGYFAAPVPVSTEFLRAGQKFSSGDIIKIANALDAERLNFRVDDQGRIEIASDRRAEVKAALAKIGIGPRSIEDLGKEALETSPWYGPGEKEQHQNKVREDILAAMIRQFDGILSAYVTINRPRTRGWLRPGAGPGPGAGPRPTAFVWLETDGGREIGHKTVQSIQNLIVGNEPDVKIDAVTVYDQKGRHYLVAGDPKYSTISATRAREEDLRQRIVEQIDWIDGVRVTVQLVPGPAAVPPPPPPSAPWSATAPLPALAAVPASSPLARTPEPPGAAVAVNTPLELDPEPEPRPAPGPAPAPAPNATSEAAPAPPSVVPPQAVPESPPPRGEVARVWVRVPRSYYFSKAVPDRDPSADQLKPIVDRTEDLIRVAVAHVVPPELTPPGGDPDLKIDVIPAGQPASMPLRSEVATDARRPLWWGLPVGVAAGGLLVLVSVLGARALAGRRPAGRPRRVSSMRPGPGRYRSDAPAREPGPGPAERVRELVRLSPEAAASVLQRWIGQEETLS